MLRWSSGLCVAILFLLGINTAQAQQYGFRIYLKDKAGSPGLSAVESFLSERSLLRRSHQFIPLNETDRPVSPAYITDILTSTGGKFHTASRWLNTCVILLEDSAAILQLNGKPYVDSVKYIAYYSTPLHYLSPKPPDSNSRYPNGLMRITGTYAYYGDAFAQTRLVNGDYLHDRDYRGEGKLIAVLDNGFAGVDRMIGFDSLNYNSRLIDQFNFVQHNNDVFSGRYNHGTSALSTMAANIPGKYVGTAPNAGYVLYVTEDDANGEMEIELDNLLAATERADSIGADIVTVSLGYNTFTAPFTQQSYSYADIDGNTTIAAKAANIATRKGMLFVASAGNEGTSPWKYILTPGDADSAITVGSVNLNKLVAPSSGYGLPTASRVKPDICMAGEPAMVLTTGENPVPIGGTSFAVSQLAGWAACLWQAKPDAAPFLIKNAIISSAHQHAEPDNHIGHGVPDFRLALQILDIKEIPPVPDATNIALAYPSPFSNNFSLKVYHAQTGDIAVRIVDVNGKEVYNGKYYRLAGTHHLTIYITSSLLPATYLLTVSTSGNTTTLPIIKY